MRKRVDRVIEYQNRADKRLSKDVHGYFTSGSDDEVTLRNNVDAFKHIKLAPRSLLDMSNFSMETTVLGHKVALPFGIAPFAMQKMLHPEGEKIVARQAFKENTVFGLSMLTTTRPSEAAEANQTGLRMLQLYFMKNADYTVELLRMAEKLGYKALAITVDAQVWGTRRKDERSRFQPPVTLQLFEELGYSFKMRNLENTQRSFVHQIKNDIGWEDIKWIKKNTHLKIILKGIMSPRDVPMAEECGVDALWISNHGGRQLDTSPATIWSLPPIRQKVNEIGSKMEIYIDGGIKKGSDIFKCLALGADFVFLGRGFLFSVIDGDEGVSNVFKILKHQLRRTMILNGASSVKAITQQHILHHPKAAL